MEIRITRELDGITVKEWLRQNGYSRGHVTSLKKLSDGITVNGEHATVRKVLWNGDILALADSDRKEDENQFLIPTPMELDILYEDGDMIAVNKPPDMATHPSIGHFADTLANGLAHYYSKKDVPFVFRAVNRLDRDTSGVVLVAKNRNAAARLSGLMKSGGVEKSYIAILNGVIEPREGEISTHICRQDASVILRRVCEAGEPGAKEALTRYRTVYAGENVSVVSAVPVTGRTHQLRVHFAHMGTPIIGDGFYGSAETAPTELDLMIKRQALHAYSLCLKMDDKQLTFTAPMPYDMAAVRKYIEGEHP